MQERSDAESKQQRQQELRVAARQFREEECRRLSAAWLSNVEPYLSMDPHQFENAVAELFRALGYDVKQTPFSNDGGKDAIATKDGKKLLIECKRYGVDKSIGRRDLQILVAAMQDEKADGGVFVNTGMFAGTAESYAAKNRIILYDRDGLASLINTAYGSAVDFSVVNVMCPECGCITGVALGTVPAAGTCPNGHQVQNDITAAELRISSAAQKPRCSACGAPMRLVKGQFGKFWGCSKYPHCKATKRIARPSSRR
jgi:restriction system protein